VNLGPRAIVLWKNEGPKSCDTVLLKGYSHDIFMPAFCVIRKISSSHPLKNCSFAFKTSFSYRNFLFSYHMCKSLETNPLKECCHDIFDPPVFFIKHSPVGPWLAGWKSVVNRQQFGRDIQQKPQSRAPNDTVDYIFDVNFTSLFDSFLKLKSNICYMSLQYERKFAGIFILVSKYLLWSCMKLRQLMSQALRWG
jgi:hypothetical protein